MFKKIDAYIIKRYLMTFFVMLLLFIPIGIMVDVAEKIDKFKENEVPFSEIVSYYIDFMWYFGNLLFPIFLFLAVIWFTTKLANNTEVIAILSSGISFNRFLRPYFISATIIATFAFFAGMFIVPESTKKYNDFSYKYLKGNRKAVDNKNIFRKINEDEYIFLTQFNQKNNVGTNFTLENFIEEKLNFKISSTSIRSVSYTHLTLPTILLV